VDALTQGGRITVVSKLVHGTDPSLPQAGRPDLQIQVRDNGQGMDEQTRQRCLEPFFSTKTHAGGTGLGLAMVFGMMRRHDGAIDIESAAGAGTCVTLSFPHRQKVAPAARAPVETVKVRRSLNLLCVDDEPDLRSLLQDCLGVFQHQVTLASNGVEGLALFQNALLQKQPFQAVITDLGMPEMDGKQFARRIKAHAPQTPVIMISGWGTMMKEHGENGGDVDAMIGKPVRMQELNNLLLELCR
jgi:CheY-like chemotaxis protein